MGTFANSVHHLEVITFMNYTINVRGRLLSLAHPQVMGILNVTPDSFYCGSRKQTEREIADRANEIIAQGGTIIDVGAFSTRPGAQEVSEEEEARRLKWALGIVRREQPDAPVSVDTYRPLVARQCIEDWGADIINDVSEGGLTGIVNTPIHETGSMFEVVGQLRVPYILMSVKPDITHATSFSTRAMPSARLWSRTMLSCAMPTSSWRSTCLCSRVCRASL